MPPFTAMHLTEARARGATSAGALRPTEVAMAAGAFGVGFVLERLFRPFRKPVVVFFRHPLPYPHHESGSTIPQPRELA